MKVQNRIMVIDDDKITRESLKFILEEEGYETETAKTGRGCVEKMQKKFFNITLLDNKLPDVEGTELLISLKEMRPEMDIIMITGNSELDSAIKALNRGASAYVLKPLDIDSLLRSIKGIVEKQRLIAEKRQVERDLRESEENYRNLYEEAPIAYFSISPNQAITRCNKATVKLLGYSEQEFTKMSVFNLYYHSENGLSKAKTIFQGFLSGEEIQDEELQMRHKNGNPIWVSFTIKANKNQNGQIIEFCSMVIDITDRKKVEENLRKSEGKLKLLNKELEQKVEERTKELKISKEKSYNIINNISDALMEGTIDGTITFVSPQIYNIIGYRPNELIGFKFLEVTHPKEKRIYETLLNDPQKAGTKFSMELRILHKKGYYVPISARGSLEEVNRKLKFFIGIRNITEQRKIDKMIKHEIRKLQELDQIRSDLIRRVSHELKTPLISIFNGSQYLLEHIDTNNCSDQVQDVIKLIHMGGYRLKSLVSNLIIAYNIESDEVTLNLKKENLIPMIKNCVEDLVFQANERKNFINLELLKELYIEVDKSMIKRAISNILSNAVKNTPTNGNIFLNTFEHPKYIDIIVKDDGVGLTKKEISLLFKKFGKIERYGKGMGVDIEGAGLGLYIANEITKLHNGEIIVKSKGRNMGSKFIIRLPIN